jgi:hypothetical protein
MGRSLDNEGNAPEDGRMEERMDRVEQRLAALERDVAVIRSNYVTKEDLYSQNAKLIEETYRAINSQTWRLVSFVCGFGTALVTATFFIATHVK